jgi:hypothetical protein
MLDGAWWPRSNDSVRELTSLIGALTEETGRVFRISLNHASWDSYPRRISAGGHMVKLGWYGPRDVHAISISGDYTRPLDLLMVPPAADAEAAEAAMATASDADNRASATDVLGTHSISSDITRGGIGRSDRTPSDARPTTVQTPRPRTGPVRTHAPTGTPARNGKRLLRLPLAGMTDGQL